MKVSEVMTRRVQLASPNESLSHVASEMAKKDIGFMPVGENDRLVGTITDRDIVTRAVAAGKDGTAHVRDVMTQDVKYCFEDEEVNHVVANMGDNRLRRLPVMDRGKKLVGIISLADAALEFSPTDVGSALSKVVKPGGPHAGDKGPVPGR